MHKRLKWEVAKTKYVRTQSFSIRITNCMIAFVKHAIQNGVSASLDFLLLSSAEIHATNDNILQLR